MRANATILSTAYFPPINYFKECYDSANVYIEHKEYYKRHSIRNRTLILGPNKTLFLTVPLVKKHSSKTLIENIQISNNGWKKKHIQSIRTAYGSSPFFIYYFDKIAEIINNDYIFLIDLNYDILNYFLQELDIKKTIEKTKSYLQKYPNKYLDKRNDIKSNKSIKKYNQIFSQTFIPNLSILDLIFNLGPNAKQYIHVS